MIKIRPDLVDVAQRVAQMFPGDAPGLTRPQIEAAIALQAANEPKPFSDDDYARLLRLRSQAFKSPDKMLKLP